jgi:hypothetical protein
LVVFDAVAGRPVHDLPEFVGEDQRDGDERDDGSEAAMAGLPGDAQQEERAGDRDQEQLGEHQVDKVEHDNLVRRLVASKPQR